MRASSSDLIRAVADTIEQDVLPSLNPADWTSSRLRSSLLILKYLERRVALEPDLVEEDNAAIRQTLIEVRELLAENLPEVSNLIDARALSAAEQPADALNETYNEVADAVLVEIYNHRELLGEAMFDDAKHRLVACIVRSQQRMAPLLDLVDGYSVL